MKEKLKLNLNKKKKKKNKYGEIPLIIACKNRNKEIIKCLLKYPKIKINMKTEYGINTLMIF
jgi:ankyrin repeat protein